jgi:hypothetical protein
VDPFLTAFADELVKIARDDSDGLGTGIAAGGGFGGGFGYAYGRGKGNLALEKALGAQRAGLDRIMAAEVDKMRKNPPKIDFGEVGHLKTREEMLAHRDKILAKVRADRVAQLLNAGGQERKALEEATERAARLRRPLRIGGAAAGALAGGTLGALLLKRLFASKKKSEER